MSLKFFHIVFIVISSLTCFGLSYWCYKSSLQSPFVSAFRSDFGSMNLVMSIVFLAIGVGLIIYGKYFYKKLKALGY